MRKITIASNKYRVEKGQIYIAADESKGGHLVIDVKKYASADDALTQQFTAQGLVGKDNNRIDFFKLTQVRYMLVEGNKIPTWVPNKIIEMSKHLIEPKVNSKKEFKLSDLKWKPATSASWDDFQSYLDVTGNEPLVECTLFGLSHTGKYETKYEFIIFKTPEGKYVPCHGSVKMEEQDTQTVAKIALIGWFRKEQNSLNY